MKWKAILCVFLVLMSLVLVGCKDTPDEPNEPDAPAYNDPTHTTGEFKVTFKMGTKTVTHRYDKGEMPDPPAVENYESGDYYMEFDGWKTELVPVTQNTSYEANFKKTRLEYSVTFIFGKDGERSTVKTQQRGTIPEPPRVVDDKDYRFVGWDKKIVAGSTSTTYTAIYTNLLDPVQVKNAYEAPLFAYQCHNSNDAIQAMPVFLLAYHEHEDPQDGAIRDRLIAQLDSMCSAGNAPDFDAWPNFSYPIITATIAVVRDTPTVWNSLTATQKAKLDTLMEAFAYICSVSTSDYNAYNTGPGLRGNYYKTWNPNYRFANVTNIIFSAYYFGAGDMDAGAEYVNGKLKAFNESAYDNIIHRFSTYGWNYAYDCWTKEGITAKDGQMSTSTAKQLLVYGGTIVHTTNDGSALKESGASSLGVSNGGNDYRYTGYLDTPFTLYEGDKIIEDMMYFNYAGGTVKSEHWADGDGDGADEKVAGIVNGTLSPYQGQEGMMTEFASGVRSSTSYCREDFVMIVPILTAASILPDYTTNNGKTETQTDSFGNVKVLYDYTKNAELWQLIQVGNEDFLYKFNAGYQSYAHGSYGVASSIHSEAKDGDSGYFMMRCLWRETMKPKGDVLIFEDMISQEAN